MWLKEDVQQIKGFGTVMEKNIPDEFRRKMKDSETKVKTVSVGVGGIQRSASREHSQILTRSNGTGRVGGASDIIASCPKQLE